MGLLGDPQMRHAHHFGLEGRLDLLVGQPIPVDASEERLLPDVHLPLWATAQTLGRMLGHQLAAASKINKQTQQTKAKQK